MRECPLHPDDIQEILDDRTNEIGSWDAEGRTRHTFPVTSPLAVAVEAIAGFWERNANNIGAHLEGAESLRGTRRLEREVVHDIADLLHDLDAEGWLTSGGTEGNITALWLAREYLNAVGEPSPPVFGTTLTHDSVHKACRLLGLGDLVNVPCRDGAVMDPNALRAIIEQQRENGRRGVIVVATVGATLTGTCDPVDEIANALPSGVETYVHVDAAFAGLVLPFTDPQRCFDFRVSKVNSIVVDLHKMARIPLGVGVFLARAGLTQILANESTCAKSVDRTLLGSRPGALAAAAWAGLNAVGRQGMRRELAYCLALKARFLDRISYCSNIVPVHDPAVNVVGILDKAGESSNLPRFRVYFMPHLTPDVVDRIAQATVQECAEAATA